jgi:hypothetical protein
MIGEIKIKRFDPKTNDKYDVSGAFDRVDRYKSDVKKYIWTEINMNTHALGEPPFIQSRVQIFLSSILLRSIFLRDGIVSALNEDNLSALFAVLKSFLEIPAILAYILDLLDSGATDEELLEKFVNLSMGNKEAGEMSLGSRRAVNVLTMFEKLDRILGKIETSKDVEAMPEKILSNFYKDICNSGHPNYNAHLPIGFFEEPGIWKAFNVSEFNVQKVEFWGGYMPHFQTAILFIPYLCDKIINHSKINNFSDIKNKLYFE